MFEYWNFKSRFQQSQHVLHLVAGWAEEQSPLHLGKPGREIYYDVTWGRVAEEDISHCGLDFTLLETKQNVESRSGEIQVHHSDPVMKREGRCKVRCKSCLSGPAFERMDSYDLSHSLSFFNWSLTDWKNSWFSIRPASDLTASRSILSFACVTLCLLKARNPPTNNAATSAAKIAK